MSRTSPKGVADHPDKDLMRQLWEQGQKASAIVEELERRGLPPVKKATLARYGQRYWSDKDNETIALSYDYEGVPEDSDERIVSAFKAAEAVGVVRKVNITTKNTLAWEKQEDGSNVQVEKDLTTHTIEVVPDTGESAELPAAEIGPFSIKVPKFKSQSKPNGFRLLVDFPDTQMGYFRHGHSMRPIHDEAALDVSYQILAYLNETEGVDDVVNQGDDLDFAEFSSHRSTPGYKGLLNDNLSRHKTHLAIQREAAPAAEIMQLYGNHEARLEKFLADKAPELLGLKKPGTDEYVLDIPTLCGYDDLGIKSFDPYPQGVWWANDFLKFHHGTAASGVPAGAAGKSLSKSNGVSVVYGHDHYQAVARDRVETRHGMRSVFSASGGCLCRLDGLVPSTAGGIASSGKMKSKERWQQGILIIYYEPSGAQRAHVEPVLIEDGTAMFRGKIFTASVDVDGKQL